MTASTYERTQTAIRAILDDVDQTIATLQADASTHAAELAAAVTEARDAAAALEQARAELDQLQEDLAAEQQRAATAEGQVAAAVERADAATARIADAEQAAADAAERAVTAEARADAAAARAADAEARLTGALERATTAEQRATDAAASAQEADARAADAVQRADAAETRATTAEAKVATQDATITQQTADLAARAATIAERDATIAELRARIAELEAQLPDAFVLGKTQPTKDNTGPRAGVTMRSVTTGTWTISEPGVYVGYRHVGPVVVTAQTGVVLRDCDIEVRGATSGIHFKHPQSYGNRVEHTRIWCAPENAALNLAVRGIGFTLYRSQIVGTGDGIQAYTTKNGGTDLMQYEVLGCFIGELVAVPDPGQKDGLAHTDCIQDQGRSGGRIVGNTLLGGRTSAVIATTDVGSERLYLHITDNWIVPNETEGSAINIAASVAIPDLQVKRNRIQPRPGGKELRGSAANRASAAAWGMSGTSVDARTWTATSDASTYIGTGSPVPVING